MPSTVVASRRIELSRELGLELAVAALHRLPREARPLARPRARFEKGGGDGRGGAREEVDPEHAEHEDDERVHEGGALPHAHLLEVEQPPLLAHVVALRVVVGGLIAHALVHDADEEDRQERVADGVAEDERDVVERGARHAVVDVVEEEREVTLQRSYRTT